MAPNSGHIETAANADSSDNYQDSSRNIYESISERTLDPEFIEEVGQVVHLTTAIFLLLLGAHLEYFPKADLCIFVLILIVSLVKMVTGAIIVAQSDVLSRSER